MNRLKILSLGLILTLMGAACASPATPLASSPTAPASAVLQVTRPSTATQAPEQLAAATASPTPAGVWIQLNPKQGKPGDTVQIEGYLPNAPATTNIQNDDPLAHANVCWQSCLTGLVEQSQAVIWSGTVPGYFQTTFTVPPIPWLGASGPQPLMPGDFTVSLQCLGPQIEGCATLEGQPSAVFQLQGPTSEKCQANQPCAMLTFAPAQAAPGDSVQVTGWAPLALITAGTPEGYSLVLQSQSNLLQLGSTQQDMNGNITGAFTVPQQIPGQGELQAGSFTIALQPIRPQAVQDGAPLLVAATPFTITGSTNWSSLNLAQPLSIEPSASLNTPVVAVDRGNPTRVAYCSPGEIKLSQDSGKTWTSIPTTGVGNVATQAAYPLMGSQEAGQIACTSVMLDATHPDSFYAIFQTMNQQYGAPPVFFMGFVTNDRGKTWKLVPAPSVDLKERFGGFWTAGQANVEALFSSQANSPDQAPAAIVEQTSDGGITWSQAEMACPVSGACLRWGPAPGSIPGMGSPLPQYVMVSTDQGKTWSPNGPSVELRETGPHELVVFSDQVAAVLSGSGEFPVQISQDGGKTWHTVALPPVPGVDPSGPLFPGLQMLPNGSLLVKESEGSAWALLSPGAPAWCTVTASGLPTMEVLLQAAGDNLWWQDPSTFQVQGFPLSQVQCGG